MTLPTSADLSSWATAIGVLVAALQLALARRQERARFEDGFTQQYRELIRKLPASAALRRRMEAEEINAYLYIFVSYFDLCNEQVYLRSRGRIGRSTWREWSQGIRATLAAEPFASAWTEAGSADSPFQELHGILKTTGEDRDPIRSGPRLLGYLTLSW